MIKRYVNINEHFVLKRRPKTNVHTETQYLEGYEMNKHIVLSLSICLYKPKKNKASININMKALIWQNVIQK